MTFFEPDATRLSHYKSIVRAAAETQKLWSEGDSLVLGISGGQDSTAMLLLLAALRDSCNLNIFAVHVHHGIRGVEADMDADFCRDLCSRVDVEFEEHRVSIPEIKKTMHVGTQEAARVERHRVLRGVMQKLGATAIALAHTRDDRVETLLFNLMRGCGLTGAVAMQPLSPPIVRPMLGFTRLQTLQICNELGAVPRCDASNLDPHYSRNRIRTELLPTMRAYYNAGVDDALLRFADVLQAEDEFVSSLARDMFAQCAELHGNHVLMNSAALLAHPRAIQRRMLRLAVEHLAGSLIDVPFATVDGALRAAELRVPFGADLPARSGRIPLRIVVTPNGVCVMPKVVESNVADVAGWQRVVSVPGTTNLPGGYAVITAAAETTWALYSSLLDVIGPVQPVKMLAVPKSLVQGHLLVRSGIQGDKISCFGMRGMKRVKEILRLAGIPPAVRSNVPIITTADGTILVVGTFAHSAECLPLDSQHITNAGQYIGVVVVPKGL